VRAACWYGTHDVRVTTAPDPAVVNPRDAVVRVTLSAICGSDLHLYNGFVPAMKRGDVLGHEFMGEIVEVGSEVKDVAVGDRVVVICAIACGRCWFCEKQLFAACDNSNPGASGEALETAFGHGGAGVFGYSHLYGGYAGGQAEYVRVPFADVNCVPVESARSDEELLFLGDILPTAWMAAENCAIEPGDVVAVFGCGPVGQLVVQCAWLLGAERVIAIDGVPERLELARVRGKAEVIDDRDEAVLERLDEMTGGRGPDACVDAVGLEAHDGLAGAYDRLKQAARLQTDRPTALRQAILACRKAGTVSIPGVYGGLVDKLPMGAAFGKGLTLRMGQTHFHRYVRPLLAGIEAGELDPSYLITHRVSLDDVPAAYAMFNAKRDGCIKVVLRP
jgi:threonine dehydrogenase-like Zn-dependent dehydrogenase